MKRIVYRDHAIERMQQRNISTDEVDSLIRNPDGIIKQSYDKSIFYKEIKQRKDNKIAVVIVEYSDRFEIITVMINFEVKK